MDLKMLRTTLEAVRRWSTVRCVFEAAAALTTCAVMSLVPEPCSCASATRDVDSTRDVARSATDQAERAPPPPAQLDHEAGWPSLFGPTGDCRAEGEVDAAAWPESGPREIWRRTIGRGYSAPAIDGGRVFLFQRVADHEVLGAYDLRTGRELWEQRDPTAFRCQYEYSDGPYATPRSDGSRVYAVGAEARLTCRSSDHGTKIWERDLHADFDLKTGPYGFGAQLWVDDRRVVINVGGLEAGIVALDKFDGRTVWTATDHGAAYTMPRRVEVDGRAFLAVLTDVGLVSLDAETGEMCDEYPFRSRVGDSVTAVTPAVCGNRLLLVAGRGPGAACVELDSAGRIHEAWRDRRALDSLFNTLVVADGAVFGFTSSRQGAASLRRVEFATGRVAWDYPSELERGQALAVGDTLLIVGEQGHLAALAVDRAAPRVLWRSADPLLAAPCYSAPAYAEGLLVVRNESTVVAWNVRGAAEKRDQRADQVGGENRTPGEQRPARFPVVEVKSRPAKHE